MRATDIVHAGFSLHMAYVSTLQARCQGPTSATNLEDEQPSDDTDMPGAAPLLKDDTTMDAIVVWPEESELEWGSESESGFQLED